MYQERKECRGFSGWLEAVESVGRGIAWTSPVEEGGGRLNYVGRCEAFYAFETELLDPTNSPRKGETKTRRVGMSKSPGRHVG